MTPKLEAGAAEEVKRAYAANVCQGVSDVALMSIAFSLKRIADAQERQAARMDALENPPSLDVQIDAMKTLLGR